MYKVASKGLNLNNRALTWLKRAYCATENNIIALIDLFLHRLLRVEGAKTDANNNLFPRERHAIRRIQLGKA
jgi:hypothetical protein